MNRDFYEGYSMNFEDKCNAEVKLKTYSSLLNIFKVNIWYVLIKVKLLQKGYRNKILSIIFNLLIQNVLNQINKREINS